MANADEVAVLRAECLRLRAAMDQLRVRNEELDRRMAVRAEQLATANAALEQVNRELEARVEADVRALDDAHQRLLRQQKLEALGQLTGGVAHDFNNLLTVVLSGLHLLSRAETPERRKQLTERMERAVGRGAELTRRLLAFSRRRTLQPETVDLATRMDELATLLDRSLRGDLRIETLAAPGLWPVSVDQGSLELALLNIGVNARDAMPHGGKITLAARNVWLFGEDAEAARLKPGDYVAVSLADGGLGMPPEVRERAFEPFFSTKDSGGGTGLGLSQVHAFAQQSGGSAVLESELGEGCTVTLFLPRSFEPLGVQAQTDGQTQNDGLEANAEHVATPSRNAHILVVEDDDEVAALMLDVLQQFGYATTRVSNVDAALGALGDGRSVDLVLSDILLTGGANGVDLAHEVERRRPDMPLILTSGRDPALIGPLGEMHWPLLPKPFEPAALNALIEASLSGRLKVSPDPRGSLH